MTTPEENRMFQEMLPWFVNGTLDARDRAWMDGYLRSHPEAQAEVARTQRLRQRVRESLPEPAADVGLDRLLHRVREERAFAPRQVKSPGVFAQFSEWLSGFLGGFRLTPAMAMAAALVVVQAGVIGVLVSQQNDAGTEYSEYRSYSAPADATTIRITFAPQATEQQIRELLWDVQASVVEGPTQFGDYLLSVQGKDPTAALAKLSASPAVEHAAVSTESAR